MDNYIDFKDLWNMQTVSQPNKVDLHTKLNKFKMSSLRKLIISNVLLISTSAFIIFIWYYFEPQLITTKIGIVLTILAMVIYLFTYNKLFSFYKAIDTTQSITEYLQKLISIRTRQQFIYSTILNLYFVLLSLGICLYLYEYTSRMTTFWAIFTYTITLTWIGFNWFYIRPLQIKKQELKINELISKLEKINTQLADE